jgi:23S rRNA (guanosine2251-2'-O)-methyltransferase
MSHRETGGGSEVVYGIHAVTEAVRSRRVDHVLVTQGQSNSRVQGVIEVCRALGVPLRFVPRPAVERAAGNPQHQNVVAISTPRAYNNFETLWADSANPLLLVLDGVEDPANLGAIIRTAVAAGSDGIVIPERRAAGISPAVARASAGALEHAKIARVTNLVRTMEEMKDRRVWVYGFEAQAGKSYLELDYSQGCALVFGGEGAGLRRLVREACDELAHIPLRGPVTSLNVSVAAAVVLYEAARQRGRP